MITTLKTNGFFDGNKIDIEIEILPEDGNKKYITFTFYHNRSFNNFSIAIEDLKDVISIIENTRKRNEVEKWMWFFTIERIKNWWKIQN